jgi:hypothetical protein
MSVIPKIPRASGGLSPPGPLPGFCPGPAGDLKRPPGPSPTHAPLTTNPGSASDYYTSLPEALGILGITDIYLNDNLGPTTPFLPDQKNLILSVNFVG